MAFAFVQLLFQMSVRVLLLSVPIVCVLFLSFSLLHNGDVFRNIFVHSTTTLLASSVSLEGSIPFPFSNFLPSYCCKTILNLFLFCQMIFFSNYFAYKLGLHSCWSLSTDWFYSDLLFFLFAAAAIPKDDFRQSFWTFCFCLFVCYCSLHKVGSCWCGLSIFHLFSLLMAWKGHVQGLERSFHTFHRMLLFLLLL